MEDEPLHASRLSDDGLAEPRDPLVDRIEGMILLGAYGDALGAPHEPRGLEGEVGDPESLGALVSGAELMTVGEQGAPWWIWPDGEVVQELRGVPTDDTAYRLMLLGPWLEEVAAGGSGLDEAAFVGWMADSLTGHPGGLPAGVDRSRRSQVRAWLEMFEAAVAEPPRAAAFFAPGVPVVFGPFQYLELGVLVATDSPAEISLVFRDWSQLDQGSSHVFTGVMVALLAGLTSRAPDPRDLGDEWLELAHQLSDPTTGRSAAERRDLSEMRRLFEAMRHFATGHPRGDLAGFVARFAQEVYDDTSRPWADSPSGLGKFHPLLFWAQMTAAVAYAGEEPLDALRLLAAGAGDADTVPSFLGSQFGAALGRRRLEQLTLGSTPLAPELTALETTLGQLFAVDLGERARRLATLSRALA